MRGCAICRHESERASLSVRLRQHFLERSAERRPAPRAQRSAASAQRALYRGAFRHRVHRATRREPELLALQAAALGDAWSLSTDGARAAALRAIYRGRDAAEP